QEAADLMIRWITLQHLGKYCLRARETDQLRILIEGDSDRTCLLSQCFQYSLSNPPHRIRDELHSLIGIELANGLEQSFVADRDELTEIEPVSLILLHVRDHEPEVCGHEPLGGGFVSLLREAGESPLFGRIRDQGEFLDVVEVLVECC